MTAAVASPPISVPDVGSATAAKNAAAPDTGDSFSAMLSQLDAMSDPSASPAAEPEKSPAPQIEGIGFADAAALVAAMTNQMPLIAQLDTPKPPPSKQDVAAPPPAAPAPATVPEFASDVAPADPKTAAPQTAAAPTPSASDSTQTPPAVDSQIAIPAPIIAADNSANDPAPANASVDPSSVAKQAALSAPRAKDEKPARAASDTDPSSSVEIAPLPDLSPPATAQMMATPTAQPSPQTAPQPGTAPAAAGNPAPEPAEIASAGPPTPTQTLPRSATTDKAGNAKSTTAADAKANANGRTSGTRDAHSPASTDPAPASANASDAGDRAAKTTLLPEHGAKSEAQPLAANLQQTNSPPSASTHVAPDLTATAISASPPAPSVDLSTPVKLSFAAPVPGDAPSFDALALRIAAHSDDGENNFSVRLDPPELGRIEVHLNVDSDGNAQASLTADKPQTLELMQKDASSLERALKDAGLNLAGGMSFSLKGDGKSQAWRDTQNTSRGRNLQIASVDAASANAAITSSAALAAQAYGLPVARLDIRI
jgi:chemotaxis protein MotD